MYVQSTSSRRQRELDKMLNEVGKAWLEAQMEQKAKWALAYDEGVLGMTS